MKKETASESKPMLREMRVEVHRDKGGNLTGHTVHHEHVSKPNKSGAFMEGSQHESFPFAAGDETAMMHHIGQHLGLSDSAEAPKPKGSEQEEEEEELPT
jgi:hypothetical protein